jgi:negative regulator of genetic competence, sporulation and motility
MKKELDMEALPIYMILYNGELQYIILDDFINKNSPVDTDGDGMTDAEEIDWSLIEEDENGNYTLPTLGEYLESLGYEFEDVGEEEQSKQDEEPDTTENVLKMQKLRDLILIIKEILENINRGGNM